MNFNYSYRAFLLTSLIFGCFILILYSIKLKKINLEQDVVSYDVELLPEELLVEETPEQEAFDKTKIETNRAYNEAEKHLTESVQSRQNTNDDFEDKLREMDEAIARSIEQNSKREPTERTPLEKITTTSEKSTRSVNRHTTVSYMLKDRTDLFLPNPVYTCEASGKIVIAIEVDALGDVRKTTWNKVASTTTNQCLIDAALRYASQAKFTTDSLRKKQLGTITFNFPGQ